MRYLKLLTISVALLISMVSISASSRIFIIENHFFHSIPVEATGITGMYMISTPNGTKASGIILSNPLPDSALKYAIPEDSVPEAAELKARFAEAIESRNQSINNKSPIIGSKFPDFSATDIDGKVWTNKDIKDKPMVLNLWYTGCGPCRAEMPELSKWKDAMPDVMFFSATYESAERARPVLEKTGFNWITLVNDAQFRKWVGAKGYPMTIVVDKIGKITHIEYGTPVTKLKELKKIIETER